MVICDMRTVGETHTLAQGGAGDRNGHRVDGESAYGEEGESGFEEHDDMVCREEE